MKLRGRIMFNRAFVLSIMSLVLLICLAFAGYDQSGGLGAENMSMQNFTVIAPLQGALDAPPAGLVPEVPATIAGDELAVYSSLIPPSTDLMKLIPFDAQFNQPMYIYHRGGYMVWNGFNAIFQDSVPGLWIEGSSGWSWYVTMPVGSWARELMFVPTSSPISVYEIYPGGFVLKYDLGYVQPGFYYVWYSADAPGRHTCLLSVGGQFSNRAVVDVYYPWVAACSVPNPEAGL